MDEYLAFPPNFLFWNQDLGDFGIFRDISGYFGIWNANVILKKHSEHVIVNFTGLVYFHYSNDNNAKIKMTLSNTLLCYQNSTFGSLAATSQPPEFFN